MADLPGALKHLSPTTWADVPQDDPSQYMSDCFAAAELLCNSIPPPPNGSPFDSSVPTTTTPNSAHSAAEMRSSSARPAPHLQDHEDLQKKWGKPQKFSKNQNPLDVALYKMAGHDRNGAWFARYNVLEGMGFAKFKKAMQREFPATLLEQGPPGAGAKRGLAADRRVERIVKHVGKMEVYQLSAQMPSPVSPREFVTLLMSTDDGLSEKSATEISGEEKKYAPRSFMMVSRPLEHPDTPNRPNFVKGKYESVEMIREIPLHAAKASRPGDELSDDPELNPVEWIMITRSDPGGGIPRFLVDRGTPEAMLTDVTKFLNWACGQEEIPDADADEEKQEQTSEVNAEQIRRESVVEAPPSASDATADRSMEPSGPAAIPQEAATESQGGLLGTLTSTAAAYTPASVSNFVEKQMQPNDAADDSDSDTSDSSSIGSFMSAEEMRRLSTAPESQQHKHAQASTENLSIRSTASSSTLDPGNTNGNRKHDSHDKEVAKLLQQREKLDQKLTKKRAAEEEKLSKSEQKESSGRDKAREKMEKEMKKTEERHRRELEKLEAKREKESKKAEDRRRKRDDAGKLSLVARERDEARSQLEITKREIGVMQEQVESLQRENTALASRLGAVGGKEVLEEVLRGVKGRERAGTQGSKGSSGSGSGKGGSKVSLEGKGEAVGG